MPRLGPVAAWGAAIVVVFLLKSYIQQELYLTRTLSQKMTQLLEEAPCRATALTEEQWQQVFQQARASKDAAAFSNVLASAGIVRGGDLGPRAGASKSASTVLERSSDALAQVVAEPAESQTAKQSGPLHRELTRELAWQHARENVIILTWTNFHFYDFVENWAAHLANLGINNFLVGAMDVPTAEQLERRRFPWFSMYDSGREDTGLGTNAFAWGSKSFHQMGKLRVELLRAFLAFDLDIVHCDSDTVWLKDPTTYFGRFPAADILFSTDHGQPTTQPGDDGLEHLRALHSEMNVGVMFLRHTETTKAFVAEWIKQMAANPKLWDQWGFNRIARSGFDEKRAHPSNDRLTYGWNGTMIMGALPVATFCGGHAYHVQHLPEVMKLKPYVVHQTFQYGGTKGKRHRLREAMLWYDPPEYYSQGPFLHVELSYKPAPENFEDLPVFNMSEFHLENMEYQLLQLREAFAVAVALNRTIIMPKLQCFCDRYWGPVPRCRMSGAPKMRLPFVCPLDHIFEPFHFDDRPGLGPGLLGPPLSFREHSFLENERTPESVKTDVVALKVDAGRSPGGVGKEDDNHLLIGANATDAQLRQALQPYASVKVIRLEFDTQPKLRDRKFMTEPFSEPELQRGFQLRMAHMPAFWCCREASGPFGVGGTPYAPMINAHGIEHHNR